MTNDPTKKLFGYSTFSDVDDPELRAWNRLNTLYNIIERFDDDTYKMYTNEFSFNDLVSMLKLAKSVERQGYENVRREIMRKNNG